MGASSGLALAAKHAGLPSVSIRMLVAPLPVFFLFPAAQGLELAILAMPFCQARRRPSSRRHSRPIR